MSEHSYTTLHIIHNDKFIVPFIDFVAAHFDANEHLYVFIAGREEEMHAIPQADNIINIHNQYTGRKNIFKLAKVLTPLMSKAQKVILHGLFSQDLINYLYLHQRFLKKYYWVMYLNNLYKVYDKKNTCYV